MKPEMLAALKESIKHWEENATDDGTEIYIDVAHCALCKALRIGNGGCGDCPVYVAVGGCTNSPWFAVSDHLVKHHTSAYYTKHKCSECSRLAKAELEFLKSLLPKEHLKIEGVYEVTFSAYIVAKDQDAAKEVAEEMAEEMKSAVPGFSNSSCSVSLKLIDTIDLNPEDK